MANEPEQESVVDRKRDELRTELMACSEKFEESVKSRIDIFEATVNTQLEKLETSVAGPILTGEHFFLALEELRVDVEC